MLIYQNMGQALTAVPIPVTECLIFTKTGRPGRLLPQKRYISEAEMDANRPPVTVRGTCK